MGMGRPRKAFDWELVDTMATLQASEEFVAETLCKKDGNHLYTDRDIRAKVVLLQRRVRERFKCTYVQYRDQKLAQTKMKLRQLQWKSAQAGNVTMQIWLGKNLLDQTDKNNTTHSLGGEGAKTVVLSYATNPPKKIE